MNARRLLPKTRHPLAIIFLMALLLAGCTGKASVFRVKQLYTSTMEYETVDANGWNIGQPNYGQWRTREGVLWHSNIPLGSRPAYLPESFPRTWQYTGDQDNFYYASYSVGDEIFYIRIRIILGFQRQRIIYRNFFDKELSLTVPDKMTDDYSGLCVKHQVRVVEIMFPLSNLTFHSQNVYFIKEGEPVYGEELVNDASYILQAKPRVHDVYDLSSPATLETHPPRDEPIWPNSPRTRPNSSGDPKEAFPFPTFRYRFAMSCRDLEGAILVVDGLYHDGKPLPPLRVRMHYYEFDKVPEYVGPQADTTP